MFESKNVITEHISEANLKAYFVGFDFKIFRYDALVDSIMNAVVDFAFGYHTGILKTYDRKKLIEAAKSIYKIKEYSDVKWVYVDDDKQLNDDELKAEEKILKRGEFGELLLHLLLRDFINTIPLLSKIYFKDADGVTIHGFDAVHIGPDISDNSKTSLFFGESKLYARKDGKAGENGIDDLIGDIKEHFKLDFLYREFALISKKKIAFLQLDDYEDFNTKDEYAQFLKEKKKWYNLIENAESKRLPLQDFLKSVTICLLCTYESKVLGENDDHTTDKFRDEFEKEIKKLKKLFDKKLKAIETETGEPIRTDLNVVLLLFPIPSKKELVKRLHTKLYNQQNA